MSAAAQVGMGDIKGGIEVQKGAAIQGAAAAGNIVRRLHRPSA